MNSTPDNQHLSSPVAYVPDPSVMVDIETHGTDTSEHAILQIGAVRFSSDFQEISHFDACLTIPEGRRTDPDTIAWWQRTDPGLYQELCGRTEPYRDILSRFSEWLPSRPHLWSWPSSFDLMFVRSYAQQYKHDRLIQQTHPDRWIDCRSWINGLRRGLITDQELEVLINDPPPFEGRIHDGLYDALWQVICLQRVAKRVIGGTQQYQYGRRKSGE